MVDIPAYYTTKTLLASDPDVNKRFIHRGSDDSTVAVFNSEMRPWTEAMSKELQACVKALIDHVG
jgi:hypothetical protein